MFKLCPEPVESPRDTCGVHLMITEMLMLSTFGGLVFPSSRQGRKWFHKPLCLCLWGAQHRAVLESLLLAKGIQYPLSQYGSAFLYTRVTAWHRHGGSPEEIWQGEREVLVLMERTVLPFLNPCNVTDTQVQPKKSPKEPFIWQNSTSSVWFYA